MITIKEIEKLKVSANFKELEIIDLSIKYKKILSTLERMKILKEKFIPTLGFGQKKIKNKLEIEIALLEQLIKHIAD